MVDEEGPGRQLLDLMEKGLEAIFGILGIADGKEIKEHFFIDRLWDAGGPQCLDLACKKQLFYVPVKKQRLLAKPVPRQEQPLFLLIPDRKGKHPVEMLKTVGAEVVVSRRDDLGVRP